MVVLDVEAVVLEVTSADVTAATFQGMGQLP